jgi:hypothetical protein
MTEERMCFGCGKKYEAEESQQEHLCKPCQGNVRISKMYKSEKRLLPFQEEEVRTFKPQAQLNPIFFKVGVGLMFLFFGLPMLLSFI